MLLLISSFSVGAENNQYSFDYKKTGIGSEEENIEQIDKYLYGNEVTQIEYFPGTKIVVDYLKGKLLVRTVAKNYKNAKNLMSHFTNKFLESSGLWQQVSIYNQSPQILSDAIMYINEIGIRNKKNKEGYTLYKTINFIDGHIILRAYNNLPLLEYVVQETGIDLLTLKSYIYECTRFNAHAINNTRKGMMLIDPLWVDSYQTISQAKEEKTQEEKDNLGNKLPGEVGVGTQRQKRKSEILDFGEFQKEKPKSNIVSGNNVENKDETHIPKSKFSMKEQEIIDELILGAKRIKYLQEQYQYISDVSLRNAMVFAAYVMSKDYMDNDFPQTKGMSSDYIYNELNSNHLEDGWQPWFKTLSSEDTERLMLLEFEYMEIRPYGEHQTD